MILIQMLTQHSEYGSYFAYIYVVLRGDTIIWISAFQSTC